MPARRRSRVTVVAAAVVAAAAVYVAVIALYAGSAQDRELLACDDSADVLALSVDPTAVAAAQQRIDVTLAVIEAGPLAHDDLGFTRDVTVVVSRADGDPAFSIPAGAVPATFAVPLIAEGDVSAWPFDAYVTQPQFVVLQPAADGSAQGFVPTVCAAGSAPGWTLSARIVDGTQDLVLGSDPAPALEITAKRAPGTVAFGLVLLVLLVTLPVLGLTVAISAYRGRRKTEATLMSWMAAMLFATVPLRSFLPGSPPIGAMVDYVVVLWVVAGLVAALVVYVLAWLRWTPAAGPPPTR